MKFIKFFIVIAIMVLGVQFAKAGALEIAAKPAFLQIRRPPGPPPHHRFRRHRHNYRHHRYVRHRGHINIHLPPPPPPPPHP